MGGREDRPSELVARRQPFCHLPSFGLPLGDGPKGTGAGLWLSLLDPPLEMMLAEEYPSPRLS
jgi:hypothetical protein